jgi:hypothetical protein
LDGGLEHGGNPGAVVVHTGTFLDAVQMPADHHDVLRRTGLGLGDDISGRDHRGRRIEFQSGLARLGTQTLPVGLRDAHHRDCDGGVLPQGRSQVLVIGCVGDDHGQRSQLGGNCLLLGERTPAPVDQYDGTLHRQAVIVCRRAPRCLLSRYRDQGPADPGCGSSGAVLQHPGFDGGAADRQIRVPVLENADLELGRCHVETSAAQHLHQVVDRSLIAGGAGSAGAVVGVGDVLQFAQVGCHRLEGDLLP